MLRNTISEREPIYFGCPEGAGNRIALENKQAPSISFKELYLSSVVFSLSSRSFLHANRLSVLQWLNPALHTVLLRYWLSLGNNGRGTSV